MSATILQFPDHHARCITILRAEAWLVLTPSGHGWLFGSLRQARRAACWLSGNLGLPIKEHSHAVGA